jgi:hypothetical protein
MENNNEWWRLFRLTGLSQATFAEKCGITRPTLARVIAPDGPKTVDLYTLECVAEGLGYTLVITLTPKDVANVPAQNQG